MRIEDLKQQLEIAQERIADLEQKLHQQRTDDLVWLTRTTTEFLTFPADKDMYQFIAERLHELLPGALIAIARFDADSGHMSPAFILGLGKHLDTVTQLLGYAPDKLSFPASTKLINLFSQGRLLEYPDNVYNMASREIPRIATVAIEKLFGFEHKYVMGFKTDGRLFGTVAILPYRRAKIENHELIEAFLSQAAVALERRRAETVLRSTENQLRQSQKMESIGRLAGGVAHDLNNMLSGITSYASLLRMDLDPDDPRTEDIEEILAICKNAKNLTGNLLGFARKGKYRKELIDLNKSIAHVVDIIHRTVSKKIVIETSLEPQLPNVQGDSGQLEQVLMNLCINASDALENGGSLTLQTRTIHLSQSEVRENADLKAGRYVQVRVIDTGEGMNDEILIKAFEPFFTTKGRGQGTGLGLSMVYGTIRNHGGTVTLVSKPTRGTTATILLPAVTVDNNRASQSPKKSHEVVMGQGTILIVDDEEIVRRATSRLLERMGYRVLQVQNGSDALEVYREKRDEIGIVLLDMIMPVMDGAETFAALKQIDPHVRVLLFSGYSADDKVEHLLKNGALGFIQKPFLMDKLAREIDQVMPTKRA